MQDLIERIEIKHNNKKLFEGYDGMVYGKISKEIKLPSDFIERYVENEMCAITDKL